MKIVKRPWGNFKQFVLNKKCTVKILEINPKQELSLQFHNKREETWYFLDDAFVQIGNRKKRVKQGSLIKVPRKTSHRIIATHKRVRVLEISLGEFKEGDEVRLKDDYGRLKFKMASNHFKNKMLGDDYGRK
jgi:mannose-6-phosphate isomerase-like protein (cupin superfamily)